MENNLAQIIFNGFTNEAAQKFALQAEIVELKRTVEAQTKQIEELRQVNEAIARESAEGEN